VSASWTAGRGFRGADLRSECPSVAHRPSVRGRRNPSAGVGSAKYSVPSKTACPRGSAAATAVGQRTAVISSWRARSEHEAGTDGVGDVRLAEPSGHGVLGTPAGAVTGDERGRHKRGEIVQDSGDERSETGGR
jgi:hypothetical protein